MLLVRVSDDLTAESLRDEIIRATMCQSWLASWLLYFDSSSLRERLFRYLDSGCFISSRSLGRFHRNNGCRSCLIKSFNIVLLHHLAMLYCNAFSEHHTRDESCLLYRQSATDTPSRHPFPSPSRETPILLYPTNFQLVPLPRI